MRMKQYLALAEFERVAPALVEKARVFPVSAIGDVAGKRGAMNARIQALGPHMRIAGPAFTVEVRAGDNLMMHVAMALSKRGDIIVVDGKNDQCSAICGELMATQAHAAGIGGFVVDCAVRDTAMLSGGPFPIFASGRSPAGPIKADTGRICIPVSVGGVSVSPGDLIVGDADGIMVLPRADAAAALAQVDAKMREEAQRLKEIGENKLIPPWLDGVMRSVGILDADESIIAACDGPKP